MVVDTRRLFARLLSSLQINTICDIGSMDGAEALYFRAQAPGSKIYAFEPNPANLRLMEGNQALRERDIDVVPMAATNYDGEADFFIVEADYSATDDRRGMSSLHRRPRDPRIVTSGVVRVRATRMDTFLADKFPPSARLALWIDAEGKAYEVLEGITGIATSVHLIHAEVETQPCIGPDQKLYPEVEALLRGLGFVEVATSYSRQGMQFNAVFVRASLPVWPQLKLLAWLLRGRLRYAIARMVRALCPACLRRYQALRSWASGRTGRLAF